MTFEWNRALTLSDGLAHGCAPDTGHDGGAALRFDNAGGGPARDYVDFGLVRLPETGVSLSLWVKTERGGGCCGGDELMPERERADIDARSGFQRGKGGVLLGTLPLYGAQSGFSLCLLQPRAYLTARVCCPGAQEWQISGLREAMDDRWHQVALTLGAGGARVYVDGALAGAGELPAGFWASEPELPLVLGADARGQNGLRGCVVSGFALEAGEQPPEDVAARYYAGALRVLCREIAARNLPACALYEADAARALLARARAALTAPEGAQARYEQLKADYEQFLLAVKQPDAAFLLVSDVHCDGADGPRTAAFCKALQWAKEIGVDAVVDCGDYSAMGEQNEMDSYWNALDAFLPGKPTYVAPGNHETLAFKCHELVRYHNDRLRARGLVAEGHDKLFFEGRVGQSPVLVLSQYSDTYTVTGRNRMWRFAGEIKREQTAWLRERLDAYCGKGVPVFVTIHNAHRAVLDAQTRGRFSEDSAIIDGAALYQVLAGRRDVVLCNGHVHHGLGAIAGLFPTGEGYTVLDVTGFRSGGCGYGTNDAGTGTRRHAGYFAFLRGNTLLLRAADFSARKWLTAYDQTYTLNEAGAAIQRTI